MNVWNSQKKNVRIISLPQFMWLFMPADLSQQWSDTFFPFIISDEEGISAAFIKIKQLLYSSPAAQIQNKKVPIL